MTDTRDDPIDPQTGEITDAGIRTFLIPVSKFKKHYLQVPQELADILSSRLEKEPLSVYDSDTKKELILDFYPKKLLVEGLGEWFRDHNPGRECEISLSVLDRENRKLEIHLEGKPTGEGSAGLYLGKKYNMVGGRKYEADRKWFLPESDLLTHVFICGVTGSGKTVVGKALIEEAALKGIPSIVLDLKGDLSSMALNLTSVEELEKWVEVRSSQDRTAALKQTFERHIKNLGNSGLALEDVESFRRVVDIRVFTPRSNKGLPIGFASPLGAPPYPVDLYRQEKETFNNLVASLTNAFMDRLYPGVKRPKIENERNYVYELVHHAWLHGINLHGEAGLRELLRLVDEPPFEEIGGLPVPQYIDAENRRKRLLNKINTMLAGPEKMWFEGPPLSMDVFLGASPGKTPINVINLTELDHFEDRTFVVAQLAYEVNKWMRNQSGTERPRLVFFIDEIGGGGGKQAFFPSFPYESAAKWGLNYLVRQGRGVGVCCVFATQNPGDVDYKGLSNCHTWIIGKLATDRDRKKVMEGMEVWGFEAERIRRNMVGAATGDFVVKTAAGEVNYVKERWLRSYHRVLTLAEVGKLPKSPSSPP
jgi:hypothetical protein